jgi:hypothetical protein
MMETQHSGSCQPHEWGGVSERLRQRERSLRHWQRADLLYVTNNAATHQTLAGRPSFEAVSFAGVLAFAAVFSRGAVAVAFAVVNVVAVNFVASANGFAG